MLNLSPYYTTRHTRVVAGRPVETCIGLAAEVEIGGLFRNVWNYYLEGKLENLAMFVKIISREKWRII